MKRVKINLAIVAVLLGTGAAFATAAPSTKTNRADVLWGRRANGTWVKTTSGALCTSDTQICKETFPENQDPNTDPSGGTPVALNGHIN